MTEAVGLPSTAFRRAFRHRLRKVHVDEGLAFPWRASCEPYVILLAEVLLQRTRGPNVAKRFREIAHRAPNARSLAEMKIGEIQRLIAPLGLVKRAILLQRLGTALVEDFEGSVPDRPAELRSLPGVGPYAAGAVLCFAFARRTAIVDSGIARIIRRCLGLSASRRVNEDPELWSIAGALLPRRDYRRHNLALLAVADRFCRVRPRCGPLPATEPLQPRPQPRRGEPRRRRVPQYRAASEPVVTSRCVPSRVCTPQCARRAGSAPRFLPAAPFHPRCRARRRQRIASRIVIARSCSGCPKRPRVMLLQPEVSVGAGRSHHMRP
jgi:A/G-specific adenine glycosylase